MEKRVVVYNSSTMLLIELYFDVVDAFHVYSMIDYQTDLAVWRFCYSHKTLMILLHGRQIYRNWFHIPNRA